MDLARYIAWLEDRVIVGDPWLLELALKGPKQAKMAQLILRTQAAVSNRLGHILDLSAEPVRRRIQAASRFDVVPGVSVRCIRCDVRAYLNDWVQTATMSKEARMSLLRAKYLARAEQHYRFMEPCDGKKIAIQTDKAISELAGS